MHEFLTLLLEPELPFLRYALGTALLASIAFGIMGTYVVTRRLTYMAGAISHSVLAGIGIALYLQTRMDWSWCHPVAGAIAAALVSALVVGTVSASSREREDTVIGAIWALGMAIGLLFLYQTPGYHDAMSYLFGNILLISGVDLVIVVILDVVVVAIVVSGCVAIGRTDGQRRRGGGVPGPVHPGLKVERDSDSGQHTMRDGARHIGQSARHDVGAHDAERDTGQQCRAQCVT